MAITKPKRAKRGTYSRDGRILNTRITADEHTLVTLAAQACQQTASEFMRTAVMQRAVTVGDMCKLVNAGVDAGTAAATLLARAGEALDNAAGDGDGDPSAVNAGVPVVTAAATLLTRAYDAGVDQEPAALADQEPAALADASKGASVG